MSEGLVAVQSRIAQIQDLLGVRPASTTAARTASSSSGTDFASALADATGTGSSIAGTPSGQDAVTIATTYLGTPYRWGGTDPGTGLDCSGLTQLVFKQAGVTLPRTAAEQSLTGTAVPSLADAKPGDLVFFGSPVHHVGIYIGDGKMLDAPHTGSKVRIEKVWGTPTAIRRELPGAAEVSPQVQAAQAAAQAQARALGLNLPGASSIGSATTSSAGLTGTPYASLFTTAGRKYGVDPALLSAVAKAESGYRTNAVSPAGARGMMQLMPGTAKGLGVDPAVASQAVDGAAKLLSGHLRTFGGRVDLALAAYNAGAGAVRKYGGVPPFGETQNYVRKVTGYWGELR